jgi:hypothetical protein
MDKARTQAASDPPVTSTGKLSTRDSHSARASSTPEAAEAPTSAPQGGDLRPLIAFARAVLDGYHTGEVGDIDGGWLQEKALELGLLRASGEVYGFPTYVMADVLALLPVEGRSAHENDEGDAETR